ncbi:phosphosulfolactate synthase [Paenibacillus beijingensis]|uniref:Phosphosulfolactate synthase n=1 Tax=Paenibacillus beijingensis TaxID=1126833 RepID=A0A0D5NQS6_9BACL|nr:phosphosulfolactate synthase [Paenibacillus beijingensis]AJY77268.1 phosphosulfolactate synthase [Paenibacillus beijingensis]
MKSVAPTNWHPLLRDPGAHRETKGRKPGTAAGMTMIIDKGLGSAAFCDLLETAGSYIDIVKLGFGTAVLYDDELLIKKILLAKAKGLTIMPGGTLLERAVSKGVVSSFFEMICKFGFNGVEVSDGTINLSRAKRTELIREAAARGLTVYSEYGKKIAGSTIDISEFLFTADEDWNAGVELITVEARESGQNVGLFDENGRCREHTLAQLKEAIGEPERILWEAPLKPQQVLLLHTFGPQVHLGNIAPADALALETMRRGLRSDTFEFGDRHEPIVYMI